MNEGGDCRTAPATPGLLNIITSGTSSTTKNILKNTTQVNQLKDI